MTQKTVQNQNVTITLNGQQRQYNDTRTNINMLLSHEGYTDKKIAIAINGQFVPRSSYDTQIIQDRDEIDIVAPMQGG